MRRIRQLADKLAPLVLENHTGVPATGLNDRCPLNVCVLAAYDPQGTIADYVRYYIGCLRQAGFEIMYSTTAPVIRPADLYYLREHCFRVVRRRNVGLDFCGYQEGIRWLRQHALLPRINRLLITNDSFYGPLHPLSNILAQMDEGDGEIWALTDCYMFEYHLQSFFLVLKRQAIQSEWFEWFWRRVERLEDRVEIVKRYEVGLSTSALSFGFKLRAAFPYEALMPQIIQELSALGPAARLPMKRPEEVIPYLLYWDVLLALGCPILKRTAILAALHDGLSFQEIKSRIRCTTDFPLGFIEQHFRNRHAEALEEHGDTSCRK